MPHPPKRRVRAEFQAWLALLTVLVLPAVLVWRWSDPRPALPTEMPSLALSQREVSAQLAVDEAAARSDPTGDAAEERRRLYRESNEAELARRDTPSVAARRRNALHAAAQRMVETLGPESVLAAQARDLALVEPALRGQTDPGESMRRLGGFPQVLGNYSMTANGAQVAPQFVVRTAFKARWNAMHGRNHTDAFSPVELKAYWGWLGLNATGAPRELRLEALDRYAEVGGVGAGEARALILYEAGLPAEASAAFMRAYEETGSFRLRNHAIAVREE